VIDRRKYFKDEKWVQETFHPDIPGSGRLCFSSELVEGYCRSEFIVVYCFGSKEECAKAIVLLISLMAYRCASQTQRSEDWCRTEDKAEGGLIENRKYYGYKIYISGI